MVVDTLPNVGRFQINKTLFLNFYSAMFSTDLRVHLNKVDAGLPTSCKSSGHSIFDKKASTLTPLSNIRILSTAMLVKHRD